MKWQENYTYLILFNKLDRNDNFLFYAIVPYLIYARLYRDLEVGRIVLSILNFLRIILFKIIINKIT